MDGRTGQRRRSNTREEVQRVALELFSRHGYDATTMQQIADEVGIKKPSLYYHFDGKEEIVRSLLIERSNEARDLAEWLRAQPASPQRVRKAVLRWVDSFSTEKLRGIRFMNANPVLLRALSSTVNAGLSDAFAEVADQLLPPDVPREQEILIRMAFMAIRTAVEAAEGSAATDAEIISSARRAAIAIVETAFPPRDS